MKTGGGLLVLAWLAAPVLAHASCDAVKASIDAKIKANGVADYTLTVVPASESATAGKVVGQCEGDKQIVYARGASGGAPAHAAKPAAADGHGKGEEPKPASAATSGG